MSSAIKISGIAGLCKGMKKFFSFGFLPSQLLLYQKRKFSMHYMMPHSIIPHPVLINSLSSIITLQGF
jgi:hypothetical protein